MKNLIIIILTLISYPVIGQPEFVLNTNFEYEIEDGPVVVDGKYIAPFSKERKQIWEIHQAGDKHRAYGMLKVIINSNPEDPWFTESEENYLLLAKMLVEDNRLDEAHELANYLSSDYVLMFAQLQAMHSVKHYLNDNDVYSDWYKEQYGITDMKD